MHTASAAIGDDLWRQMGNEGWAWDDVLPFFKQHQDEPPYKIVWNSDDSFSATGNLAALIKVTVDGGSYGPHGSTPDFPVSTSGGGQGMCRK